MTLSSDIKLDFFGDARRMCEAFGLKSELLQKLLDADDWAFCVQVHCILEICVNRILEREVQTGTWRTASKQTVLDEFWPKLPLSGRSGRVNLVRQLGALPDNYCQFIEELSSVRNAYCHDARTLNKTILEVIASGDDNVFRARRRRLYTVTNFDEQEFAEIFEKSPKFVIWMSLLSLLGFSHMIEKQRSPLVSLLLGDEETNLKGPE